MIGALGAASLGDPDDWGLDAAGPAVFLALLAPMLRSTLERAVAGLGVVLRCVPVLPAGVPVLVAALAAPVMLAARGRRAAPQTAGRPEPTTATDATEPSGTVEGENR